MPSPSITVGLPVTENLDWIEDAVRSVFAQTMRDWELIIVTDGAAPEISDRLSEIADSRVRLVVHESRAGLPTRLNEITQLASAPYIARMDGDDLMHPNRLERQLDHLWGAAIPIDVLGTASILIDEQARVKGLYREPALPPELSGYLQSGVFSHPTVVFSTEWAKRNPYDPSRVRTEDKELWMRTASTSRFEKIPDKLLFCRVPSQLSQEKQALTSRQDRKLLRDLGPSIASPPQIWSKQAKSLAKQIAFWALSSVGRTDVAHRGKFHPLPPSALEHAELAIRLARQTSVPGWD